MKYFNLTLLILLSIGVWSCSHQKASQSPPSTTERTFPVSVTEVIQKDVPIYLETIGHVRARSTVQLKPEVGGQVKEIYIKGGDHVQEGQVLYQINPWPYQIALNRVEALLKKDQADLKFAQERLERYLTLVKSDFVSKLTIQEYMRDVKVQEEQILIDQADIDHAKLNLSYCLVKAPLSGKIGLSKVDRGNIVKADDPEALVTILQVQPISVYFSLSQKEFQQAQEILRQDKPKFSVFLPYGSSLEIEGQLEAFDNQFNSQTGTIQLKGNVANQDEILWPDEFVRVHLFTHMQLGALIIPAAAIQMGQNGSYVYTLQADQTVKLIPIQVGQTVQEGVIVEKGLQLGMQVVTNGQVNLKPGAKVELISSKKPHVEKVNS